MDYQSACIVHALMSKIHQKYPIPSKLNVFIIGICSIFHVLLLWTGSQVSGSWVLSGVGLLFAINLIPVYSLIHEAEHGLLHANGLWNYLLGVYLGVLFFAPFSFLRKCHLNHHSHNRTDYEMWDLYYEHQNKWLKHGYLYLLMMGLIWILIAITTVLFCFTPWLVHSRLFTWNRDIRGLIMSTDRDKTLLPAIRESWIVLGVNAVLFMGLNLAWQPFLIMFLIHGFVWSSQNYVNHAFSPRDIINGAHNHRLNPLVKYLYLNFHLHLAHHQNPKIPWIHLNNFVKEDVGRYSYWKTYLRLWKGPELTREPPPIPIREEAYEE